MHVLRVGAGNDQCSLCIQQRTAKSRERKCSAATGRARYLGALTGGVLGSHYADIFAFVALILVLTLRPQGLLGERVADRA